MNQNWIVELHDAFDPEFDRLPEEVQDAILERNRLLKQFGPLLGRPHVDTLKNSKHPNMKELRFDAANGVWRVAFAFDSKRKAILLVAGDKSGGSERQFYNGLIAKADARFDKHLTALAQREVTDKKDKSKKGRKHGKKHGKKS
jgi:hypothetical protein